MNSQITKERAVEFLGGYKKAAKFWGIKRQAIYQWPDGEPIPELRELQLLMARPEAASESSKARKK